ncbi:hypothetical protein [Nonomuraea wenchangensis]|uniref:hypothetical protein n=1 Tax=Nonomuraea wenchangensis TaxID=568860 RepID=UPI0033D72EFF
MSDEKREREQRDRRREQDRGTTFDAELHNMGGDPGFRVTGPVDEAEHGMVIDDEGEPPSEPEPGLPGGEHISAGVDWVASDEEDDPDGGSGRTADDDGGYLPGEGTGRPY